MARAKREPKKTDKETLHEQALERYKLCETAWAENHKRALADIKFRNLEQWPTKVKEAREKKGRPTLVVDKVNQYVRQVVNDGRQNRPSVKVRPVDDKADIKVAEGFQGIIRGVLANSNADEAFDTALDHAAGSGFGYFRLVTEYADDSGFEQDIFVRRVVNPLSVMLDPTMAMADGSDAEYGFVVEDMSLDEFKRKYPNAEKTDWTSDKGAYASGWLADLTVRVCEYFYKVEESSEALLLADGTKTTLEEYEAAVKEGIVPPAIVNRRMVKALKVKWCRMSGAEVLEEADWLGKYIPIIPVWGTELNVDGKMVYSGLVRPARDPQMLYNFSRSAFAERVALAPKSPWIAANGQVANNPEWESANTENHSVLKYDPVDVAGHPVPPPSRVGAADIPAGFAQDMQISEHDIQAAIGMYSASVGEKSNEKSGRAIMARQREGDTATFHYLDNLNRGVRNLGRQLVDLAPKVYDSQRIVRVLGEGGDTGEAQINPGMSVAYARMPGRDGKPIPIYNLNVGRYDVDISAGPSYTTKRQEAADAMIEMTKANPSAWVTHGDLIVKSQDWPGADEFAERSKATMPPELKAAIAQAEQDGEDGPSDEVKAIVEQANRVMQEKDAQIQEMGQALQQGQQMIDDAKRAVEEARGMAEAKMREIELKGEQAANDAAARAESERIAAEKELAAMNAKAEADRLAAEKDARDARLKEEEIRIKAYDARTKRIQAMSAGGGKEPPVGDGELTIGEGGEVPFMEPDFTQRASPDVLLLAQTMQEQTAGLAEALVRAISAPRVNIPERDPATGRISRSTSVVAPPQIQ